MMRKILLSVAAIIISVPVSAATYKSDIVPIFKSKCDTCHGAKSPYLSDFKKSKDKYKKENIGPRMDTYADLIFYVGWPDTGAIMRRLDDGTNSLNGKPGNMYQYLGANDGERKANFKVFKAWVGEDAWNLKRWNKKGDVPGVTKEEVSKLKIRY